MRTKKVRVARRHARSMRFAMLFLVFSLAIYLITYALGMFAPDWAGELVEESPKQIATDPTPVEQVTRELRFEGLESYLVQIASCATAEEARIEAARYVRRGAAGYVMQGEDQFVVIGACYESEEEASKVCERLIAEEQLPCKVRLIQASPAALRVTATQAQIDALASAEQCLRKTTVLLSDICYALDSGTMSGDAALDQLSRMRVDVDLRLRAMERAMGDMENPVVQGLWKLMSEVRQGLADRIVGSETTLLSFSAKIKYNKITMRMRHIAFLNELSA